MTIDVLERLRACRVTDVQKTYDEETKSTFVEATVAFRCWSGDPNGAAGIMLGDAAQEIIRLRLERDEARRQRDEARREVCGRTVGHELLRGGFEFDHNYAIAESKRRGWDCFKEDGK